MLDPAGTDLALQMLMLFCIVASGSVTNFFPTGVLTPPAATPATAPAYVAMMLMVPGGSTGYVVALGWISNTMPRPPAKRAAALAAINAVSNTSSIYASYMFPKSDGPRYV